MLTLKCPNCEGSVKIPDITDEMKGKLASDAKVLAWCVKCGKHVETQLNQEQPHKSFKPA